MASGPLKLNKVFYNVSVQLGRQSRDNQTLLSTSALGLQTAGVAIGFGGSLRGHPGLRAAFPRSPASRTRTG